MFMNIDNYCQQKGITVPNIKQVKKKLVGLRVYWDRNGMLCKEHESAIDAIIQSAEMACKNFP